MRVLCSAVLLLVTLPSQAISLSATRWSMMDIGSLGGGNSWPHEINESGQVIGRTYTTNRTEVPFLWQAGTMIDLSAPDTTGGVAEGLNDLGQVVGTQRRVGGVSQAFVWHNGAVTWLSGLPTTSANGTGAAINNAGVVVGGLSGAGSSFTAVKWSAAHIPTALAEDASAADVNDDETTIGRERTGFQSVATRWTSAGKTSLFIGGATAINESGQVVGFQRNMDELNTAFPVLYDGGTITRLRPVSGRLDFPLDINDSSVIVGRFEPSYNVDHGFIWFEGQFVDLNTMVDMPPGTVIRTAEGVNNSNQIVGLATNASGTYFGYVLNPIPEPGSVCLLLMGLPLLRRR